MTKKQQWPNFELIAILIYLTEWTYWVNEVSGLIHLIPQHLKQKKNFYGISLCYSDITKLNKTNMFSVRSVRSMCDFHFCSCIYFSFTCDSIRNLFQLNLNIPHSVPGQEHVDLGLCEGNQ